jgi:hypothetical protein
MKKKSKSTRRKSTAKKPKKRSKKSSKPTRLWGLEVLTFPRHAQEPMEMDEKYRKDLKENPDAAAFLSKFNDEFYGNTFRKGTRPLHKKSERKTLYNATNARNRDMYNRRYRYNDLEYVAGQESAPTLDPSEALIDYLDQKNTIDQFMADALESGLSEKEVIELTTKIFDLEGLHEPR